MTVRSQQGCWATAALACLATLVCAAPAHADVSRSQATTKALTALEVRSGREGVVVFGARTSVRAGAVVTQAGPDGAARTAGRAPGRLAGAGVRSIRAPRVLTAKARSWLFYADEGPNQAFEHPGRVVLVERATGAVRVSDRLRWVPLVDGRRPAFFRSATAYQGKRYRVFERAHQQPPVSARAAAVTPAAEAAQQRLADALAAERSCALRVSDTLGDFYDFGRVDKTRASLGRLLKGLAQRNPGFVSGWYQPAAGRTPAQTAQSLIDRGCKDLFLYVAGGATRSGDAVVGVRPGSRGSLQWHVLGGDAIEALVRANRGVTFKLAFDTPYAGRIAQRLTDEENVLVLLTAGGRDEQAFSYLPEIVGPAGIVRNTQNPFGLLEFTNGVIRGLERFVTDPAEIDHAIAEQAAGRTKSVMAWMLARSLQLGPSPFSNWLVGGGGEQRVPLTSAASSAAPPPARINQGPTGTTPPLVTREDTPRDLTLTAGDPDGDPLTFTVVGPPAHGTLTGTAPFLRYAPTSDFAGADQVTYRVTDGRGGSDQKTVPITVTPENDAPALVPGVPPSAPAFAEDGAPVALEPNLQIADGDSTELTGARVEIAAGRRTGDVLAFTAGSGITGSFADGVLTLTGTASVTAYRDALRSVTFGSTSHDPGTSRTVRFRADDAGGPGPTLDRPVTVVPSNDAPQLTLPGAQTVAEDATLAAAGVSLADPDAGAGPIAVALAVDHGTLGLAATTGLTFTAGDGTGDEQLAFTASPAAANAALAGLTYAPDTDFSGSDALDVDVDDQGHAPGPALTDDGSVAITVTAVNDAPVNAVPGAQTVAEDTDLTLTGGFGIADVDAGTSTVETVLTLPGGAVTVDDGGTATVAENGTSEVTVTGTVAEVDAALDSVTLRGDADGTGARTLTVTTGDGSASDTDTVALTVTAVNDAPTVHVPAGLSVAEDTPVTFDSDLRVGDVDAGSGVISADVAVDSGSLQASTTGTLSDVEAGSFTVSGTLAQVNDALDGLVFTPAADDDGGATLTVEVDDAGHTGGGALTDTGSVALDLTPVNDAPRVAAGSGAAEYTEGGAAVTVEPQLGLTDPDDVELTGATVTIGAGERQATDELSVTTSAGIIGTYASGVLTLSGPASVDDYRATLRTVTFRSTGDDPGTSRTITFAASDGEDAGTGTRAIAIAPVNDAPVVTPSGGSAAFAEDGAPVAVDPDLAVDDADDTHLESATMTLGGASHDPATDVLAFAAQDGITVQSWTQATGTLVLTGHATPAAWRDALRAVTFAAQGDAVAAGTRTVTITAGDGALDSDPQTRDVAVTASNDAPVVTTSAGSETHAEGAAATVVDDGVAVADPDATTTLTGARVKISDGTRQAGDALGLTGAPAAISVTAYDATTGELVLSGTASIDDYEDALRAVTFTTSGDDPSATRTIGFFVDDGTDESGAGLRSLTIAPTNDAPVLGVPGAQTTAEDADLVLDGADAVTVGDPDAGGAVVEASAAVTHGTVTLGDTAGITVIAGADGTPTVTFEGTLAAINGALDGLTYRPTADFAGTATLTLGAGDRGHSGAGGAGTDSETVTIAVTAVDDRPSLTTSAGATAWTEGTAAVAIDPALIIGDIDDANLEGATVVLTAGGHAGDRLVFDDAPGLVEAYDAGTRTLTITGTATVAAYEAYLRTVRFDSTSPTPTEDGRTFSFRVDDGDLSSAPALKDLEVTEVNSAPSVTTSGGTASFTEDGAPVPIDGGLTVADADSPTLASATVQITGDYAEGADTLAYTTTNGITGSFDAPSGTLTLTGAKTPAEYEQALRSVGFDTTDQHPATSRTIAFRVDDGSSVDHLSPVATRGVTITRVNDKPVVTTSAGTASATEDGPAVVVDPAVDVTDVDSPALAQATVTVVGALAGDVLDADVGASGLAESFSGGVLTLSGPASLATYRAVLRTVTFATSNDAPGAPRTIAFRADDGAALNALSDPATRTVTVAGVNDAPVLGALDGGSASYTENQPPVTLDSDLTVGDADSTDLTGGTVEISAAQPGDELSFTDQGPVTGSFNPATGRLTISGTGTLAQYQAFLRSVAYRTTADDPGATQRTVTFAVTDGAAASTTAAVTVSITPADDAPTLTLSAGDAAYTEDAPPALLDAGVTVADPDDTHLEGATVVVGDSFNDTLSFDPGTTGITDANADPKTLALVGHATKAQWETVLRSVRFASSDQFMLLDRTVTYTLDDGERVSAPQTKTIVVTAVNDAPTVTQPNATLAYTENDPATQVAPNLTLNDTDASFVGGATIQVTSGCDPAQDVLAPGAMSGSITAGAYDAANCRLTFSGHSWESDYQAALRNVTYRNTSDTPSTAPRTVTFTVRDTADAGLTGAATRGVAVAATDDPGVAGDDAFTGADGAIGNTTLRTSGAAAVSGPHKQITGNLLTNDTDPDGLTAIADSVTSNDGASVTVEADGDFIYRPVAGTSCTDTADFFDYRVGGGDIGRATVSLAGCVWYVNNNAAGNAGTSSAPFDTLAQAETASGANGIVYVHDGDNSSTGYGTGYQLEAGERLIGESHGLVVDPDGAGGLAAVTLHAPQAGKVPTLSASNEDVIALDDGNEVRDLVLDPAGTGGGIGGTSGDTGGATIEDVTIADTSTAGTQPGLELDGTTGTFDIDRLTVANGGSSTAVGVQLTNAGAVDLDAVTITTTGARALQATGTDLATSVLNAVTVTGSSSGGIDLDGTTGAIALGDGSGTDLDLTTTGGSALRINDAAGVSADGAGTDTIAATGGPAITSTGTSVPSLTLDTVSSSGSPGNGITFRGGALQTSGGTLSGFAGTGVDLGAGSGTVDIGTNVGNGPAGSTSVVVTGRTGGAATISGTISDNVDSGGGISVSSNAGSVTFSGASKNVATGGTGVGVDLDANTGPVAFTGGGLSVSSGAARAFEATGGGAVSVTGAGNHLASTTGGALLVQNTTIASDDLTFASISSANAVNGIRLDGTSNAAGSLNVTGSGGACTSTATCTGGSITGSSGPGVSLSQVPGGAALDRVAIVSGTDDGINATSTTGLAVNNSWLESNGNSATDEGVDLTQVSGAVAFSGTTVTKSSHTNVTLANTSGNVTATFTGGAYTETNDAATGAEGILLRNDQTGTLTATVSGSTFAGNAAQHVRATTDNDSTASLDVTVAGTTMSNPSNGATGGGIRIEPGGTSTARTTVDNNTINGSNGTAIDVLGQGTTSSPQPVNIDATITNNRIGTAGVSRSGSWNGFGIAAGAHGGARVDTLITSNTVRQWGNTDGITLLQTDGTGVLNATVRGNTVTEQAGTPSNVQGIRAVFGATGTDTGTGCLDLGGAGGLRNTLTGSANPANFGADIRLRQAGPTTLLLPGYAGAAKDADAVDTYLLGRNTAPAGTDIFQTAAASYQTTTGCPLP